MCHSCESRNPDHMASYFLDCRFRGSGTPHPASLRSRPASPAGGEARCFIRLKCYENRFLLGRPFFRWPFCYGLAEWE